MNSNGQKVKLACTDPSVGDFLFAYEMKAITPEDRDRFERHLFDCDYCLEELERFEPYADALRADNERLHQAAQAQKPEPVRFPVAVPDPTRRQQTEAEKPTR